MGLSGIEASSGPDSENYNHLIELMENLGYKSVYQENPNQRTGSAIFYKKDKLKVVESHYVELSQDEAEFLMYCILCPIEKPDFKILFAETELIDDDYKYESRKE